MFKKTSHFLVFFIFLGAFAILLFFNYKSYKSTQSLIKNNDELIDELELSSNIQFFQTHLILLDNSMNEALVSLQAHSVEKVERELKILNLSSNYLNTMFYHHRQEEVYQDFARQVKFKLNLGQRMIDEFKMNGKFSNELQSEIQQSAEWNDLINEKLVALETVNEEKVIEKSDWIKKVENRTQSMSLYFLLISSVLFAVALVYIFNKIRKQQNLIEELEIAKTKEIKLNKIKDDFIANMSHEIRTPLNVILGFSSLMEKEKLSDRLSEMVQTLKNAGGQLMMIVNQVLDVAKMEEGTLELDSKPFQLKRVGNMLDSSYRKMLEDKGLQFEVKTNVQDETTVIGDQIKLIQIVSNLLSNAHKFTSKGKISLELMLKEDETDAQIQITVSDTGIGIEKSKLTSIFDRFEQADNNITRNYGGTGLGLAIVKQLVDIMNGKIEVDSALGQGSKFVVTIPVRIEKTNLVEQTSASIEDEIICGTKILVVEDNSLNTKLIQNWLEPFNLELTYTMSAIEALDILKNQVFDIILLDIQMPGMDGYTCAQYIRNELGLHTPIIGMTAHTRKQDMLDCYTAGMQAHIAKPIDQAGLFYLLSMYSRIQHATLINHEYLKELSGGNEAFIQDLIDEFLKQTPIENEKLRKAFFDENLDLIKTTAHTLKTTYGYLGMDDKFIEIFRSLENCKEFPKNYNSYFLVEYLFERVMVEVGKGRKN
ncbi:MAG: hybrid sensor histidine kinase/response regulator [Chitinophagales bacterium]